MKSAKSFNASSDLFSPRRAAEALNVSESSVKRWCDQGLLDFVKTPGGHRRLRGDSVRRMAQQLGQIGGGSPVDGSEEGPKLQQSRALLRRGLLAGDAAVALAAFAQARVAVAGMAELADRVIVPVLAEVGKRWQRGTLEIYEERRACELLARALGNLCNDLPAVPSPTLYALGGSLPGDPFTLPNLLAELVLREAGCAARSLGSELPASTLERALAELKPQLLWISVGFVTSERELLRSCQLLHRAASAQGASLVLGGRGLSSPGLRSRLRYAMYCESMTELREFALALSRVSRR